MDNDYDIYKEAATLLVPTSTPAEKLAAYLKTVPWAPAIERARVNAQYWMVFEYFYYHDDATTVVTPADVPFTEEWSSGTALQLWKVDREPDGYSDLYPTPATVEQVIGIDGDLVTVVSYGVTYENVPLWIPITDHAVWDWATPISGDHAYTTFVKEFLEK